MPVKVCGQKFKQRWGKNWSELSWWVLFGDSCWVRDWVCQTECWNRESFNIYLRKGEAGELRDEIHPLESCHTYLAFLSKRLHGFQRPFHIIFRTTKHWIIIIWQSTSQTFLYFSTDWLRISGYLQHSRSKSNIMIKPNRWSAFCHETENIAEEMVLCTCSRKSTY